MKFRNTLILLAALGAVIGYLYFVEKHQLNTTDAAEKSRQIVEVDRDQSTGIAIKTPEGKLEFTKKGGTWFLESPVKDRADTMAISQLFTSLELLKYDAIIGGDGKGLDKDQVKDFGLNNSETKIRITGSGKPVELLFGKDAAVEGKVYVKPESSNTVYVIGNDLKNQLAKKPDEFRDKKLTDLSSAKVSQAVLTTGAGEMAMEKRGGHWSLVRPLKARGDDLKIGDIISTVLTARIDQFLPDGSNLASYGLDQPRGSISIVSEGTEQPAVLNIGASLTDEKSKDKTYAKWSSRDAVVVLPESVETLLSTKLNDLRDKSLTHFEDDIVDRINIEPAGKEKLVLARDKEKWVRKAGKDEPIDGGSATRILESLRGATVSNFVSDVATDLSKYGLESPVLTVTLSSYSSENTAETKAGERPIVSLHFGATEGADVYVKVDDEPFIVSVPATVLNSIITDPLQLQDTLIYPFKAEDVSTLEVTKDADAALSFARASGKTWNLAKGDGVVNQTAAQSLVNTLAGLRAVRWLGPTAPEHGLENPTLVIAFSAAGTNGKLTLGAITTEEMWSASAQGKEGTFLISRPDGEALRAALIDKPATASTPAPASAAAPASGTALPGKDAPAAPAEEAPAAPSPTPLPSEVPAKPVPPQL